MIEKSISVVIPTFGRDRVLLDTIAYVLALAGPLGEVIIVDQTPQHDHQTTARLAALDARDLIQWLKLDRPSIPHAMNIGIGAAAGDVVLFLDDDIIPDADLLSAHWAAQVEGHRIVAGRVLQPWDDPSAPDDQRTFRFSNQKRQAITEVMGGNLSVDRLLAIRLGGFDENFVRVAYRFEAEFSERMLAAGERILFEPAAVIRHLKVASGGTRTFGHHLQTASPSHTVGAYYHLLRTGGNRRLARILVRPLRSVRTRHHITHPWWIPATLLAELLGLLWAIYLVAHGPRLIGSTHRSKSEARRNSAGDALRSDR